MAIPWLYQSEGVTTTAGGIRLGMGETGSRRGRGMAAAIGDQSPATRNQSGLGDITVTAGYVLLPEADTLPQLRPYALVKLPTAEENMGTGEYDLELGLNLSKWLTKWYLFGGGSVVLQGGKAELGLQDFALRPPQKIFSPLLSPIRSSLRYYLTTSPCGSNPPKKRRKIMQRGKIGKQVAIMLCGAMLLLPQVASAHCDGLDGPVVNEARIALEKGELAPVLKWVKPEHEETVRQAFAETRRVRALSPEARDLADRYFFETLVRVHREGEGAAYTGLKPAGMIDPPIVKADAALAAGSVDHLAGAISNHVGKEIRERFAHALDARKHADANVAAGREYVEAYVQYVHFIEGIVGLVHGKHAH